MPGTVAEGPSVSMSCRSLWNVPFIFKRMVLTLAVANNFWGKDDAGVQPLLERMHNAKVTCDELKAFYNSINQNSSRN